MGGPRCGPANLDLCDDEKEAKIAELMAMPLADLNAQIAEKDAEAKKADEEFQKFVEGLQNEYEEGEKKTTETKKEIKESGLGLIKATLAFKRSSKAKEEL